MDLIDIKYYLLKHQQICSKIPSISAVQVSSQELISPSVSISRIFYIRQGQLFSGTPESICYSFFLTAMCQARIYSLSLFFHKIRRPFPTNRLLSIVIDKFSITEFAILIRNVPFLVPPSTLGEHNYGVSVILRKVCCEVLGKIVACQHGIR